MLLLVQKTGKISWSQSVGDCSLLRNPWRKPTGLLEHCREEQPTVGSPYFGAFPSDRIPKATKDVNVHLFIYSFAFGDKHIIIPANSGNVSNLCIFTKMYNYACCSMWAWKCVLHFKERTLADGVREVCAEESTWAHGRGSLQGL